MKGARARLGALAIALVSTSAAAHEVRPAYLELRPDGAEHFDVLFKVPGRGDQRLGIDTRLPERCEAVTPRSASASPGAFTERWRVRCAGGLAGASIAIDGLSATLTDALVRIPGAGGSEQVARLTPSAPSFVVGAAEGPRELARTYLWLGVEHILLGIDHLLFVLALLLLVEGGRRLVGTITAFTAAHSLTLAAATLGFVYVPPQPVEAAIALSIVFVAGEVAHAQHHETEGQALRALPGRAGLTRRWPWIAAFGFGLLHGLGFAGALREVGLPPRSIPAALLFFNVGVELGQLVFVAASLAAAAALRRLPAPRFAWAPRLLSYAIGALAAFWTIERVARFWT